MTKIGNIISFCIPKIFNNPLKAKIYIRIQSHLTPIVISIFPNEKPVYSGFLKGYQCTKLITYHFLFGFSV